MTQKQPPRALKKALWYYREHPVTTLDPQFGKHWFNVLNAVLVVFFDSSGGGFILSAGMNLNGNLVKTSCIILGLLNICLTDATGLSQLVIESLLE